MALAGSWSDVGGAHIQAFTFSSQDHGRLSDKHISKHSRWNSLKITVGWLVSTYPGIHFSLDEDTLKITVGCLLCTYPSIHVETLRITVGCLWSTYPSIRNKNLHTCGLWARPPVLTPVPVPSQAIHRRAGLNLHYSDIQSTAQKSPCVNTFFEAFAQKQRFVSLASLGRTNLGKKKGRLTKNKKGGNFLLQEYFRRRIYFWLQLKINSKKSPPGEITGVTVLN